MTPYYRPAEAGDEVILAPKLRKQDAVEVMASAGLEPLAALKASLLVSEERYSIIASDGTIVGMFGVAPTGDKNVGCPWLLGSDRLPEVRKEFLPQSLEWVKGVNKRYPLLINYVDVNNTKAIRWLKYLGFTFISRVEEYGVGRIPFYEFVRIEATNV